MATPIAVFVVLWHIYYPDNLDIIPPTRLGDGPGANVSTIINIHTTEAAALDDAERTARIRHQGLEFTDGYSEPRQMSRWTDPRAVWEITGRENTSMAPETLYRARTDAFYREQVEANDNEDKPKRIRELVWVERWDVVSGEVSAAAAS